MSLKNSPSPASAGELIGIGLISASLPVIAFAIAKGLLFANYFELGLYRTAFYYFWAAINDYRLFLGVFFAVLSICFILRKKALYYAVAAVLAALLLATAYRLNRSPWYPDIFSLKGFWCNAAAALSFVLAGVAIFKKWRRTYLYAGFSIGLLWLVVNGYFYYSHAKIPAIFTDVTERVGVTEANNSLGVAWGDYNNDGWPDLYVSNHLPITAQSYLYQNKKGVFSAARVMATGDRHGPAWADYDNDGALDLFVAGGNNTPKGPPFANILFHNQGGNLQDVASKAGVEDALGRAWGGAWADFNNDGLLDLFVANYFTSNALFLNAGNGTFANVAKAAGITDTSPGEVNKSGTLCASWADYDGDGDMDLLTVAISTGIALYRNDGRAGFTDVAQQSGLVTDNYLGTEHDSTGLSGCAWGDYDNDGDLDLYVGAHLGKSGKNLLFQNQGNGIFLEVAARAGVDASANARAAIWGDYDNDGDLDLYVVNEASDGAEIPRGSDPHGWNALYLNRGDGTFVDFPADKAGVAGFPFVREGTAAIADYDNDGCIDIFINNQRVLKGRPSYLIRNILLRNSGNRNNWLEIRLRGTKSNRDGIGAKVSLFAGNRRQFREQNGGAHTFAQNSTVLHFGLGEAKAVDRLLVKWPSGITQTLTALTVNRILTITEP